MIKRRYGIRRAAPCSCVLDGDHRGDTGSSYGGGKLRRDVIIPRASRRVREHGAMRRDLTNSIRCHRRLGGHRHNLRRRRRRWRTMM